MPKLGRWIGMLALAQQDGMVMLTPETLRLDRPIPNDKLSKTGKSTAYTMGQRYVASERLKQATVR